MNYCQSSKVLIAVLTSLLAQPLYFCRYLSQHIFAVMQKQKFSKIISMERYGITYGVLLKYGIPARYFIWKYGVRKSIPYRTVPNP